jgi:hypothetical protein
MKNDAAQTQHLLLSPLAEAAARKGKAMGAAVADIRAHIARSLRW